MADLTGQAIKNTYKDLLQVSNSNAGVDTTLRSVEDGEGTGTLVKLSTTATQLGEATLVDRNENEIIKTAGVSLAVNEITVTNAATGANPTIGASGGDSTVGIDFATKGGASFAWKVNSATVMLLGATGFTGAAGAGAKLSGIAYPTTDGTLGEGIVTDGAGTLSFAPIVTGNDHFENIRAALGLV